jgi:sec-independent protein translocase protein TatA
MGGIGPLELGIVLVIVLVLFGVGRVSKIGGELGSAVANFRRGMSEARKQNETEATPSGSADSQSNQPA